MSAIFSWIGTNESVLSGIAATIVILGVLYVPIRKLVQRANGPDKVDTRAEAPPASAALHTESPSIAVMPFANLSGDAEQEFLADGLTEDIILGLSRVKQLFVIARNTCFTYKGKTLDAQTISRELGVRYVLEGSVRKSGDRIRITAQLVDAQSRTPTWAERYDRKIEEILEVDDEVTEAIVAALHPALRRAEAEHARRASPGDLNAWGLVNQAWVGVQNDLGSVEVAEEAIRACERALKLDPNYAFAHAVLAHAKSLLVHQAQYESKGLEAEVKASIQRALELAEDDGLVHHCHAAALGNLGDTRQAIRAWERAVELNPNNAAAHAGLGIGLIYIREAERSLALIDGALRRSPADPLIYHWLCNRAFALLLTGNVTEAIEVAKDSMQRKTSRLAIAVLTCGLACDGMVEEATRTWTQRGDRFADMVVQDYARAVRALAPDPECGKMLESAMNRVAEAVSQP